ncbi:hypothetical protein GAG66_27530 [Bacteroides thetaiotaomicron]|nr:hypothetical protein GAG66_27530 [Bacteroides thetaiotaomicron]
MRPEVRRVPVLPESTKADFLIYTRVVYRSNNNANALGGVSYANANNDSSNTNANIGVRLANN